MNKSRPSKLRIIAAAVSGFACIAVLLLTICLNSDIFKQPRYQVDTRLSEDFVRFFDVGQGDCILICSNGYSALIDTGTPASANQICTDLQKQGIEKLDALIITHLHDDHIGGVERITQAFPVENLILPTVSIQSEGLTTAELAIARVTDMYGNIYQAVQGMNFKIGDFELTILAAFEQMSEENDRSLIISAKIEDKSFLFTGDAEHSAEKALLNESLNLECDVLKVGHHGSKDSSCEEFLKAAAPDYSVISVGIDNTYGHPHKQLLSRLDTISSKIYRTDTQGDIIFYVKDKTLICKTER